MGRWHGSYWRGFLHGLGAFYLLQLAATGEFYLLTGLLCVGILGGCLWAWIDIKREARKQVNQRWSLTRR